MKQIIVLRTDLKMRRGKEIAQGAHACLKAILNNRNDPRVIDWYDNNQAKIAVGVDTEADLVALVDKARSRGIISEIIIDAGRTEFNGVATLTCAAIGPDTVERIDDVTGHLKLR